MVHGVEYHPIIQRIFGEVRGIFETEQIKVCCPRCQEEAGLLEPDGKFNLEINTEKEVFKCWKCSSPQFSGTLWKLIKLYGNKQDLDNYKEFRPFFFGDKFGKDDEYIPTSVDLPSEFISFKDFDVNNPLHLEPYLYMIQERNIPKETLIEYNIGFALEGKYKNRVIIPSFDRNMKVNYFVSRLYYKPKFKTKTPYLNPKIILNDIVFNEYRINWDMELFIFEGAMDYLSYDINSTILSGKVMTERLLSMIRYYKPPITFVLDNDAIKSVISQVFLLYNFYDNHDDIKFIVVDDDINNDLRQKGREYINNYLFKREVLSVDYYFR